MNHSKPNSPARTVLRVDSSARLEGSISRQVTDALIERLETREGPLDIAVRDLALEPPSFVDAAWVEANFTSPELRTAAHAGALAASDLLVAEVKAADVLVIGAPIYNFGIPAKLKAWIDMIARARLTFRYTENGPVGLLGGKKAYLAVASGGTAVGSEIDFATGYLRHVLAFLGIEEVEIVAADRWMPRGENEALGAARSRIDHLLPATEPLAATA